MAYARIIGDDVAEMPVPSSARRLDTGEWVLGLPDAPDALKAACGFKPVTETPRPADTPTDTFDRTITLLAGTPTVAWAQRPKTEMELNPPKSADELLAAAREALVDVDALTAPVTSVDVIEVLLKLKTALGG